MMSDFLQGLCIVLVSGVITWFIIDRNRKINEKNACIHRKNELLRDWERRALYIWSGQEGIDLNLEYSYLASDIKRIEDQYKKLKEGYGVEIPSELGQLRDVVEAENMEEILLSPENAASKKLRVVIMDRIKDLTEMLESNPS